VSTPASNDGLSLALIGVGRWGKTILRALETVPGARVAFVASTNAETARLVPEGCSIDASWRAVANADGVDAVIIATPAALHAEMALAALSARKAVFVEKPLALTPSDARRVATGAEGGVLCVDHLDLCNPAWHALKGELLRIDEVVRIEATFGTFDGRADVSPLWDWGPHAVALCIDLAGRPSDLSVLPDGKLELRFASGCRAHITLGNRLPARARRLVVFGKRGALAYDDNAEVKVLLRAGQTETAIPYGSERPLTLALRRFVSMARAPRPSFADAELGVAVVDVLASASAQMGANP
jgi:UDP-2-acetamido-3-amino-2,3-dideoxy-glucuronate N-acetyltransferase